MGNKELLELIEEKKNLGYQTLVCYFNGYGDQGDIESATFSKQTCEEIKTSGISHNKDLIEEFDFDKLEVFRYLSIYIDSHDWYNNEGGDVYLYIDLTTLKYQADYYISIVTTEDYSETGSIIF